MYKPLTIGFLFPYLSHSPWQLRGTPQMLHMAREMPKMLQDQKWPDGIFCANFLHGINPYAPCRSGWCGRCYSSDNTLHNFYIQQAETFGEISLDQEDAERLIVAWGTRHKPVDQFTHARDGDSLLTPFECDLCIFHKLIVSPLILLRSWTIVCSIAFVALTSTPFGVGPRPQ
jgi:hypothetical protein